MSSVTLKELLDNLQNLMFEFQGEVTDLKQQIESQKIVLYDFFEQIEPYVHDLIEVLFYGKQDQVLLVRDAFLIIYQGYVESMITAYLTLPALGI